MEIITGNLFFIGLLLLSEAVDPFTGSDLVCLFLPSDGHVDFETEFFTPFYLDTQFGKTFLIICNFFGVLKKLIILGTSYQNL